VAIAATASVSVIEGIGPAATAALAAARVFTVFDVLRTPVSRLRQAVASMASEDEVRGWKAMAVLLEVAEVTPQWAEALARGGIATADDLRRKRLGEVEAILRDARDRGTIPEVATADQIAEMLKDAALLACTGAIVGTVVDPARKPITGATLHVGPHAATTDARGRFRLARIPLGRIIPLRIEHPDFPPRVVERPRVARSGEAVDVQVFSLGIPGAPPAARLSELDGQAIPVPQGHTVRQVAIQPDQLRAGDILMVREVDAARAEVELVSRLKAYESGEVLVFVVRVPRATLPAGLQTKDHFRFDGTAFSPIEVSPRSLHRYKIRLRMQRAFAGRPQPTTTAARRAEFEERLNFLFDQGYFFVRKWNG
jgi:hypothetical protein